MISPLASVECTYFLAQFLLMPAGAWQSHAMAQQAHAQHMQAQQLQQSHAHAQAQAHAQVQGHTRAGYPYAAPGMQQYPTGPTNTNGQMRYTESTQGGSGYRQASYGMGGNMPTGNMMQGWQPGVSEQRGMPGMQSSGPLQQPPMNNDAYEYWQVRIVTGHHHFVCSNAARMQ